MPPDYSDWELRLQGLKTFVAIDGPQMAGFISLKPPSHIELLYTHPDWSRSGVASTLFHHVNENRLPSGLPTTVDASIEARPFFEHQGFVVQNKEQVERNGETFLRFRMIRFG